MTVIAVLGLGEAGRLYAQGLAASGAVVKGYDPFIDARQAGVAQFDDLEDALTDVDLAISLVGAAASRKVVTEVLPLLPKGAIFADFNTAAPATKAELAELAAGHGIALVDVAVMAPVDRAGSRTPLIVSGDRSNDLTGMLRKLDVPVERVDGPAGAAASRKLLRSVFMKGLAGLVLECQAAGEAANCSQWLLDDIAGELGPNGKALVARLIDGSRQHAARRTHEVADALQLLRGLGSPTWMTEAALSWLHSLSTPEPALHPVVTPSGGSRSN